MGETKSCSLERCFCSPRRCCHWFARLARHPFLSSHKDCQGTTRRMRANSGVLLGYAMHAVLAAFGVAALVAASPLLFENSCAGSALSIWRISP